MDPNGLNQLEGIAIGRLSLEEIGRLFDKESSEKSLVFVAEKVNNPKNNAIPLIQEGVELDTSKLAIFRNHGIHSLVVILVEESLRNDRNLNTLKIAAIRKWKDNEDVRVEAKKKAEVLQATAVAIYRAAVEFCAQFSDVGFTDPAEIEDKVMVEKVVALGTAIEDFGPAVMEAFYDLENGNGSILREIDELSKPTEDEARESTQFSFDVLRVINSFNRLYKREHSAFVYDVSLKFEHTEVVRMFLAAFFMPSAFWGGWQGENHELRSAAIFATIRKYKDTLPEGVEILILNHSRIDWINHYAYERNEDDPSVIEKVDVSLMRSALVLAITEDFSGKVSKGISKRIVAEEIATRYYDGPTLYEPHRHVNMGLPLYSYVLTALFNAHSVFPAGTILEFDRRDLVLNDKIPKPPSIIRLAEKLCAISMGGNSVPELYPLVWIMWERRQGTFSQLLAPDSGIVSMSSAFYHGRQSKQMCWAVGLKNTVKPHPHYRVEVPRAIGLMDKRSYKAMLGSILTVIPNYIQHFVDTYMKGKKQH